MPFVSIDYFAGISPETRRTLQERLTGAVVESLGAPAGSVRVFTRAVDPADVYCGDGEHAVGLPVIRVEFLEGRTYEQQKAMMKLLARSAAGVLGIPADQVRTIVRPHSKALWARGEQPVQEPGA